MKHVLLSIFGWCCFIFIIVMKINTYLCVSGFHAYQHYMFCCWNLTTYVPEFFTELKYFYQWNLIPLIIFFYLVKKISFVIGFDVWINFTIPRVWNFGTKLFLALQKEPSYVLYQKSSLFTSIQQVLVLINFWFLAYVKTFSFWKLLILLYLQYSRTIGTYMYVYLTSSFLYIPVLVKVMVMMWLFCFDGLV